MRLSRISIIVVVVLILLAGCGSNSDKVLGFWKEKDVKNGAYPGFIEIGKNYIVFDGERKDGIILADIDDVVMVREAGTQQDLLRLILSDDDNIIIELPLVGKKSFVRSSKEEMESVAKAKAEALEAIRKQKEEQRQARLKQAEEERQAREKAAAEKRQAREKKLAEEAASNKILEKQAQGLWVEMSGNDWILGHEYNVLELHDSKLEYRDEVKPFSVVDWIYKTPKGETLYSAFCFADKPAVKLFAVKGFEDEGRVLVTLEGLGGLSPQEKRYRRTTREEIAAHDQPDLKNLKGFWQLEGEGDVYKVIAFSEGVLYTDGHSMKIDSEITKKSPQLYISPKGNKYFRPGYFVSAVYLDPDKIMVRFGVRQPWYLYRRLNNEAAKKALASYKDVINPLAGFWKSQQPVTKDLYAFMVIRFGKNTGKVVEDVVYALHTDGYKNAIVLGRGVLGYFQGKVNDKIRMCNNNGSSSLPVITVIDANTIECDVDRNAKGVRFSRVKQEDVPEKLLKKAK